MLVNLFFREKKFSRDFWFSFPWESSFPRRIPGSEDQLLLLIVPAYESWEQICLENCACCHTETQVPRLIPGTNIHNGQPVQPRFTRNFSRNSDIHYHGTANVHTFSLWGQADLVHDQNERHRKHAYWNIQTFLGGVGGGGGGGGVWGKNLYN